jgi:hypothetical protein
MTAVEGVGSDALHLFLVPVDAVGGDVVGEAVEVMHGVGSFPWSTYGTLNITSNDRSA